MDAPVSKTVPSGQREFKAMVARKYDNDIQRVNRALDTHFSSWNWFFDSSAGNSALVLVYDCLPRFITPAVTPFAQVYDEFKMQQPPGNNYCLSVEGFFKERFLKTRYTRNIKRYNTEHGTQYDSYDAVSLANKLADCPDAQSRTDWETFVRNTLNLLWVRVDPSAAPHYRALLEAKYRTIQTLNRNYDTDYSTFAEIPLIDEPPLEGIALSDWEAFISGWKDPDTGVLHAVPAQLLRVHSVEFMFRDHLADRYRTVDSLNSTFGTSFKSFTDILPPQKEAHYISFLEQRRELRKEFAVRNYRTAFDYMLFHGRGLANTAVYCSLAVLFALIVNPMAAYAMSRYRMPSSYKILLFLMLTMAFPAMVTQIPVFIMLRQLNLLNTFAALILPGLANGYSIFLLKGFFDSLPRELYESAEIDGANEWTMFWQITMSLSKPILAVVALNAFTLAYSNFMLPLIVCQDEKMWTLMVWLYQLQQRSGQGVVYASLIVAAIPTFLIFVFCQKIIMRGIVVPVEK
jgi:multiple sugar transport system permease protein